MAWARGYRRAAGTHRRPLRCLAMPSEPAPGITDLLGGATSDGGSPLRLSFSRVDTYRQCPLKYRYRYVDLLAERPSPHLSFGSSIHAALEVFWDRKLPHPPPREALLAALYERWDSSGFAETDREEQVRFYRHAQEVLAAYHRRFADVTLTPVAVEQWFRLPLPDDVEVVGAIDLVEPTPAGGLGVVDWKTNRRAKTREEVAGSLQLAIYALAVEHLWGQPPEWVALDFVVPGVRVTVPRDRIDADAARRAIGEVAAAVRAGTFTPRPSPLCDWCDFRAECPAFAGEGPDVAGTAVNELRRLRRRQARDAERAATLERIIAERLGEAALTDLD